jgi:hypothetical protein
MAVISGEIAISGPEAIRALKTLPDSSMHRAETSQGALQSAFLPKHSIIGYNRPAGGYK